VVFSALLEIVSMTLTETTLTSADIVADYGYAYRLVYDRAPAVRYVGNQWYAINGQTVHRSVVLSETERLHDLARKRVRARSKTDKGVISRIIAKLRNM
jgi:hypothetical protein